MICSKSYGTYSQKLADEINSLPGMSHDRHHSTLSHISSPRM